MLFGCVCVGRVLGWGCVRGADHTRSVAVGSRGCLLFVGVGCLLGAGVHFGGGDAGLCGC